MTPEGFDRALRSFARRSPFAPFWVEFVTGHQIHVVHPEAVHIRGNVVIHIATDGRQRLFDSTSVCQLLEEEPEIILPPAPQDEE